MTLRPTAIHLPPAPARNPRPQPAAALRAVGTPTVSRTVCSAAPAPLPAAALRSLAPQSCLCDCDAASTLVTLDFDGANQIYFDGANQTCFDGANQINP